MVVDGKLGRMKMQAMAKKTVMAPEMMKSLVVG
jgi:hypothetical protein